MYHIILCLFDRRIRVFPVQSFFGVIGKAVAITCLQIPQIRSGFPFIIRHCDRQRGAGGSPDCGPFPGMAFLGGARRLLCFIVLDFIIKRGPARRVSSRQLRLFVFHNDPSDNSKRSSRWPHRNVLYISRNSFIVIGLVD